MTPPEAPSAPPPQGGAAGGPAEPDPRRLLGGEGAEPEPRRVLGRGAVWLPGGNLQTIWASRLARRRRGKPLEFRRERWDTPDGDFIDVDWLDVASDDAPLLVLFHGLEGSSRSHYAQSFGDVARSRGWRYAVPHFRGCSGELNRAPRAYHSGDHEEIGWILARARAAHRGPLLAVGISLGGNALLRWAEEAGAGAPQTLRSLAAVSAPLDLRAGADAIGRGFNQLVYARMFLATMKPKALAMLARHPGLFDAQRVRAARTIYAFDDAVTAPLHGFRDAPDYYRRASAKPHLARIGVPTLVLNARNDPFVPGASLPRPHEVGRHVTLWQPAHGGHAGFPSGAPPGHVLTMPEAVTGWLAAHL